MNLMAYTLLHQEHVIARVRHCNGVVAYDEPNRLGRNVGNRDRELVQSVREVLAHLRVNPLRITNGKYLRRVREVSPATRAESAP